MKKKILYLITKSNWGGAQRYVFELANALPPDEFRVVVAFGGDGVRKTSGGALKTKLEERNIQTIFLKHAARDIYFFDEFKLFFEILELIKKEMPDVVHVNSSKAGGLGALAARLLHVPRIVFTAHGWPHQENRPLWQRTLIFLLSWFTVLLSHTTVAVSEKDLHSAPAFLKKRSVRLIRNGVAEFSVLSKQEARKFIQEVSEKKIPEHTLWIGTIAELTKNKSLDTFISAGALVPDVQLVIIGAGEERGRLELLAAKSKIHARVHFVGFVEDARRLLGAFDIFVLPSLKEGLPYVLLEAGTAGLPVVASAVGGIPEIIEHGKTGLLVSPKNPVALARQIEILIEDIEARSLFGKNLKERIVEKFSFSEMLKKTIETYL